MACTRGLQVSMEAFLQIVPKHRALVCDRVRLLLVLEASTMQGFSSNDTAGGSVEMKSVL